jgi:hypothetical protein
MLQNVLQNMLRNNLIVFNPKYVILDKTNIVDQSEIKSRASNTYLNKIIGYSEKKS